MSGEEELMVFLNEKPHFFVLTRDKDLMPILRDIYKGGKTFKSLCADHNMDRKALEEKMLPLVKLKVVERIQKGTDWIYFLSFEGTKFMELYLKTKEMT